MASMNDKTAFQIGADAVSKIAHPRKHSQAVDNTVSAQRCFLDELNSKVSRACMLSDSESQSALKGLLDDIRFSDPVSVEAARQDEIALISLADGFLYSIENDETVTQQAVDKARALLKARNDTCKNRK